MNILKCYTQHKQGFYVYAKPNLCVPKVMAKYIGRYLGRPVIATSRIDRYDGDSVTFHYNRHEDEQYVEETLPVMDFIKHLIRHIPEKHFKMIRYGGYMQDTVRLIRNCTASFPEENTRYTHVQISWNAFLCIVPL